MHGQRLPAVRRPPAVLQLVRDRPPVHAELSALGTGKHAVLLQGQADGAVDGIGSRHASSLAARPVVREEGRTSVESRSDVGYPSVTPGSPLDIRYRGGGARDLRVSTARGASGLA